MHLDCSEPWAGILVYGDNGTIACWTWRSLDKLAKLDPEPAGRAAAEVSAQPRVNAVQSVVSGLAMAAIEKARSEGHTITIPSLGISIPPDDSAQPGPGADTARGQAA